MSELSDGQQQSSCCHDHHGSDLFVTWSYVHPYSCRVLQLNSPWSPAKRWFDPWEVPDIRNVPKDSKTKTPSKS